MLEMNFKMLVYDYIITNIPHNKLHFTQKIPTKMYFFKIIPTIATPAPISILGVTHARIPRSILEKDFTESTMCH